MLYGERGLKAFEVKTTPRVRPDDLRGLERFQQDFPEAKLFLVYPGTRRWHERGVEIVPFTQCVTHLAEIL